MLYVRKHLKDCTTLRALSVTQLSALAQLCQLLTISRGTSVYYASDEPRYVYLVAEGRVRICHIDESGKQSILLLVQPGQLFGELAVCLNGSREERGETTEDSKIVAIPTDKLRQVIRENAELSFDMLSLFSVRRQATERRFKCILFQSSRHRLLSLLKELAEIDGTSDGSEIRIRHSLSHQDLASMIGVTRETVTLTLGQLRNERLVRIDNGQIVIRQPDCLRASVPQCSDQARPPS